MHSQDSNSEPEFGQSTKHVWTGTEWVEKPSEYTWDVVLDLFGNDARSYRFAVNQMLKDRYEH